MIVDAHRALIWTMVLVSAADGNMTDAEMRTIGENARQLQVFRGFDVDQLPAIARECREILADADGLKTVIGRIRSALPERLSETAYALACDIVLADPRATREELRFLELIRDGLGIDRLIAAAIERGSRARHAPL